MKLKVSLSLSLLLNCLIFSAFLSNSFADTFPPGAKEEWSQYFAGDPVIPDPEINLEKFITAPEVRCVDLQKKLIAQAIDYGRKAFVNKNSASQKAAKEILNSLHQLEDSNDICFESVARTYLAVSLHLLNPSNSNVGASFNNARIKDRPFAVGLELTLLGAALLNHHSADGSFSVQFLTPGRRLKNTMAAVWNQKTGKKGTDYLVSAGYDCAEKTILIDPYLMPLNLASTFVHELDHFFRDRVVVSDYSVADESLNDHLPLAIAMDETLASVMSAYFQRHMEWFHDFRASALRMAFIGAGHPLPFNLSDDLSLFRKSKDAPINQIWTLLIATRPRAYAADFNPSSGYFLGETFLRGDPVDHARVVPVPPLDAVQNIYQTIHKGYFGGAALSSEDLALLDPSLHPLSNDPFSHLMDFGQIGTADDDQSEIYDQISWVRDIDGKDYWNGVEHKHSTVRIAYNLDIFFKNLDSIFPQLFKADDISPYCSRYLKGLQDGELDTYVGNSLSSGVKPGETGVKSGETGVKSGETGVKSGETGVKPSLVRPCLNIGQEL